MVRVKVLTDWAREEISVAVLDNIMCVLYGYKKDSSGLSVFDFEKRKGISVFRREDRAIAQ